MAISTYLKMIKLAGRLAAPETLFLFCLSARARSQRSLIPRGPPGEAAGSWSWQIWALETPCVPNEDSKPWCQSASEMVHAADPSLLERKTNPDYLWPGKTCWSSAVGAHSDSSVSWMCLCIAALRGKTLVTRTDICLLGTWEQRKEMSKGRESKIRFWGKFWFVFIKSCWVFIWPFCLA